MKIYNVMLESRIDNETGYFVTVEVAARTKEEARNIALAHAARTDIELPEIEEIEFKEDRSNIKVPQVTKVYGRSYFPLT